MEQNQIPTALVERTQVPHPLRRVPQTTMPLVSSVTLDKALHLCMPQFPQLQIGAKWPLSPQGGRGAPKKCARSTAAGPHQWKAGAGPSSEPLGIDGCPARGPRSSATCRAGGRKGVMPVGDPSYRARPLPEGGSTPWLQRAVSGWLEPRGPQTTGQGGGRWRPRGDWQCDPRDPQSAEDHKEWQGGATPPHATPRTRELKRSLT